MDDTRDQGLLIALSVLRLSTGILLLYSLFLGFVRHRPIALASPVEISAVVVAHVQPRRALILTLLTFAAFTYLLDELIVLFYYLYQDVPSSSGYQWRGVELADVLGFMAFSFIIIIGITKDKNGMDFWSRRRLRVGVILALVLDIAYLVLLLLSVRIFRKRPGSPGIPERPNVPGIDLPNFLHFLAVDARILALFVLVIVLFKPATHYSAVHAPATPSTGLVPAAAPVTHSTYGTFSDPSSAPKHAPNQNNDTTASGTKATEDYAASHPSHSVAEGSAGGSQTKPTAAEEPHVHVPIEPAGGDVPKPVTDDPFNTSYAAVAAAHADKDRKADENENADEGRNDAVIRPDETTGVTDSPTAFAFPSSNRDDSSLRGVTFSADADNGSTKDALEGPGGVDKKRRRISSQNIKRIVRKITDIPRRKDSISSIGSAARASEGQTTPKKMRMSREDSRMSGEGSLNREGSLNLGPAGDDSPAPSIGDSAKKAKAKKRMSLSLRRGSTSRPKPEET